MTPSVDDITAALHDLHRNYSYREHWAFFPELRIGTGYGKGSEQRIDAFALALWPSKNWASHAYEIKVNRADFLKELRSPLKRRAALRYSNMFWFVTPEGLVKPEEIPVEAGLMEAHASPTGEGWYVKVVVSAPWRDIPPPTWNLFASVARRVQRLEAGESP
jgi:hypothetical protein